MGGLLIDTNVFSFISKQDTRAAAYEKEIRGQALCLSFMLVAELRRWALHRRWGPGRRKELEEAMQRCRVLGVDDETSTIWAKVVAGRDRIGRPIGCGDAWISACALRHSLSLLTHNPADFAEISGLAVISHGPQARS